ncbi:MAG: tRNA dihydrouridine synthase DusB [Blautia sp.]|nr:tRNA dihydrouridine synthase DusB [Blautia sp.]
MPESAWRIGRVVIPNRFALAPMAGVTDLPFRLLCKEQGAGLICMEMVSAKAISYHNKNTQALLEIHPAEHPVSLQLFGNEPELMGEVAKSIEELPFDILDLNMGCPVPKVVNNNEGSALLKDPVLVARIVSSVSHAVSKPVTAKIRIGFEGVSVDIPDLARRLEDAGAAAIIVHGRTRQQYYSGKADWEAIRLVKEAVTIPVIGNGDIDSGRTALKRMIESGCDAVMVGRAARGNPWIFQELNSYFAGARQESRIICGTEQPPEGWRRAEKQQEGRRPYDPAHLERVCAMILRHAGMQVEYHGEKAGMREMRKHIAWYTAGMPHGAVLRREANTVETYAALQELLDKYTKSYYNDFS